MPSALAAAFVRLSADHLGALLAIALLGTLFILGARRRPLSQRRVFARGLAIALLLLWAGEILWRAGSQEFPLYPDGLPLHYCSVAMLMAAAALWYRSPLLCGAVFFSVMTASIQALITPALELGAPSLRYLFFFASHGALLIAAAALPLALGWRARRCDPLITLAVGDVYLLAVHPINLLLGTNYGFTLHPPVPGTLLDYAGPAPWYYLALQLPALALFYLIYPLVRRNADPISDSAGESRHAASPSKAELDSR